MISTPKGDVLLAPGRSVELADHGNPHLRVEVTAPAGDTLNLGAVISETRHKGVLAALHAGGKANGAKKASLTSDGRVVLKAENKLVPETPTTNIKANRPDCEEGKQPGGPGFLAAAGRGNSVQGKGGADRRIGDNTGTVSTARAGDSTPPGGGNTPTPAGSAASTGPAIGAAQSSTPSYQGGAASHGQGEPPVASSAPGAPGATNSDPQQAAGAPETGKGSTAHAGTRAPSMCS